jgi:hypothetical protein
MRVNVMAKEILNKDEKSMFNYVIGFTTLLEEYLHNNKKSKKKISKDDVVSMPTYEFVSLALNANSPRQVILAIETIRKRYLLAFNFDREAMGFLDSIEGKAYGYIALAIKDVAKKQKLYDLSCKYFKSAISKGYFQASVDLADVEEKFYGDRNIARETLYNVKKDIPDVNRKMGELFFNFSKLVENSIRVLEGKRPFIEDSNDLALAEHYFNKGKDKSVECCVYKGLILIITGDEKEKKQGLELVRNNLENFKLKNKDIDKILFKTDAQAFKNNISLIENKLLKLQSR